MQYPDDFMICSSDGEPLNSVIKHIHLAEKELLIFAPYISVFALEMLKIKKNISVSIITTLKIKDWASGSSDSNLFPYCVQNEFKMFVNNHIHLKAFVCDWKGCFYGSSNLTGRGLAAQSKYNLELNGFVGELDAKIKLYFKTIINSSFVMTDTIYRAAQEMLVEAPSPTIFDELDLSTVDKEKDYLISSLPMSMDINKLFELVSSNFESEKSEEVNCAIHDCLLYGLSSNQNYNEFIDHLRLKFFNSNFIIDLLYYIDNNECYFGRVKKWIQENCESVPVPSMRDLTGNIQVLYMWIVELSEGRYAVDRPNHSERIYRVK